MTVRDVLGLLRRHWKLGLAAFAVVMAAGAAGAFLPADRYRSSTTVVVQPRSDRVLEFGEAVATEFLLPTVVRQVEAETFGRTVAGETAGTLNAAGELPLELSATNEPGTGIVVVEATSRRRDIPQTAADVAARQLIRRPLSPIIEITVLDPAQASVNASAELRLPILFGTFVLALIAAGVAAIGYGTVHRRLDTANEIRERFGLDVLGEIPQHRRLPTLAAELFGDIRHRHAAEDYQRLRTVLELLARRHSTIAVTSWTEGEGKTTVIANAAWAIAAGGREVLAVDCDLRRPKLHEHLGVPYATGVADVARGQHPDELAVATAMPALEVLPAGVPDQHPTAVLRTAVARIAEEEEARGRLVLIDSPPMFTPEATTIATTIDAVVVVIDGRRRDPAELEALIQDLRLAGAEIMGVVINRARAPRIRGAAEYYYNPARTAATPLADQRPSAAS
jgi:Mrp family chromosome partitioning ATPase/capsular polysaccharide biosynthesis protein